MPETSCADQITVCWAITPDDHYRMLLEDSVRSVLDHTPSVAVRVRQAPGGDYPYGMKPEALPEGAHGPVLFVDADTLITGDLAGLVTGDLSMAARVGSVWGNAHSFHRPAWEALFAAFGLAPTPLYNAGAVLCSALVAGEVRACWLAMLDALERRLPELEDPLRIPHRPAWWMRDQYALALAVSYLGLTPAVWTRAEHSFGWAGESGGLIHHLGRHEIERRFREH